MPNHSLFIAAGELPRPNVYLVTLHLKEQGTVYATHSLFLAADAPVVSLANCGGSCRSVTASCRTGSTARSR